MQQQQQKETRRTVNHGQRRPRPALQKLLGTRKNEIEVQADRRQQDAAHHEHQQQHRLRDDAPPVIAADVGPEGNQAQEEEQRRRAVFGPFPEDERADAEQPDLQEKPQQRGQQRRAARLAQPQPHHTYLAVAPIQNTHDGMAIELHIGFPGCRSAPFDQIRNGRQVVYRGAHRPAQVQHRRFLSVYAIAAANFQRGNRRCERLYRPSATVIDWRVEIILVEIVDDGRERTADADFRSG